MRRGAGLGAAGAEDGIGEIEGEGGGGGARADVHGGTACEVEDAKVAEETGF